MSRRPRPSRRAIAAITLVLTLTVAAVLAIALGSGGGAKHQIAPVVTTTTTPATTAANPPGQPPPATAELGASVNRLFNDRVYSRAEIAAQLAALAQTGATVARSDAFWEASEPSPPVNGVHRYDWTFDDEIAGSLAAHGLRWLPIIDYSAPWAQSVAGRDHSPPSSAGDYAAYAAAVARRYGNGGSFWSAHPNVPATPVDTYEIWNEPDNPQFWSPAPDAAAYAALYVGARAAIAAVQPGARVIVGGLTHPASFLPQLLAADPDLRGHVDGVGIHPYGATPGRVLDGVRTARATLDSIGMHTVPLYVTELGWTTSPPGALDYLPERLRPSYIQFTLAALGHLDCGLAETILYTWVTPERDPANAQDWFGIHPPAGGTSPDAAAFADGLRAARASGPATALCRS